MPPRPSRGWWSAGGVPPRRQPSALPDEVRRASFSLSRRKGRRFRSHALLLATTEQQIQTFGLRAARQRWLRPAVGFNHPRDVLKDPDLEAEDKRAVLASWLSDASAVQD